MADKANDAETHLNLKLKHATAKLGLERIRLLARKFDPDQPRVPAGDSDGGQWASGGGGSGSGDGGSGKRDRPRPKKKPAAEPRRTEPGDWKVVASKPKAGGGSQELVKGPDGTQIFSDIEREGPVATRKESRLITLPDKSRLAIQTDGGVQTIRDADGTILSQTKWTPTGPVPLAMVQPAFAPAAPAVTPAVAKTIELGSVLLFNYLSSRDENPALAFRSWRYDGPKEGRGSVSPMAVPLSEKETKEACPRIVEAQNHTDKAAGSVSRFDYRSAAEYGTAVHSRIKKRIDALGDPNLVAERSYLKSSGDEVRYGRRGSLRVDILEDTGKGVVCVYDVKTGKSGLSRKRIHEIAATVADKFGAGKTVIIIEMRPK